MSTRDPKRLSDGVLSLEHGVDSGKAPNLLETNQCAWAINTTFRGGWPTCRPAWKRITLDWQSDRSAEPAYISSLFQVIGGYTDDSGNGSIISMHGGRVFRLKLSADSTFKSSEISITGDYNSSRLDQAWCAQGENLFVIQDGQSRPFIFDGASSRRAKPDIEIPVGRQITYYMGRFIIADGLAYVAGDMVYGNGNREDIIGFTENPFLNEGGAFGVPSNFGDITGLIPIANLDTALGQGDLIVVTRNGMFATYLPQDRDTWKDVRSPLQRVIQLTYGATSQASMVGVNSDVFYRSIDGVRSLVFAVRRFSDWGNSPISCEMRRIFDHDAENFLRFCSATLFDGRLLMTASPGFAQGRGVYHRCLGVIDFDLITEMREKSPPAWEGIWTGLNILQLVKVQHQGVERCFAEVLNGDNQIELWELTKDGKLDNDQVRIEWSIEHRSMDFGSKFDMKELASGDLFLDQLSGEVDLALYFRPDGHPCWVPWDTWSDCGKYKFCAADFGTCPTLPNYQDQYRPKRQFRQPPDTFDPITKELYRRFYESQIRITVKGHCRLKQLRLNAHDVQEEAEGRDL